MGVCHCPIRDRHLLFQLFEAVNENSEESSHRV